MPPYGRRRSCPNHAGERASLVRLAGQLQRQTPPSARGGSSPSARLFAFDPNRADSLTLLKLGLESWQVGNIMKYRRKGGRWRSPEHFSRLYGLSRSEYERLRPYLRIAAADAAPRYGGWPERSGGESSDTCARHRYQPVEKYAEGTVIALNQPSVDRFESLVRPGGILIYDNYGIHRAPTRKDIKVYNVAAMDATLEMKNSKTYNMIVLGALLKVCPMVTLESVIKGLKKSLPERHHKLIPLNEEAIRKGMSLINE